MKAFVSLMAGAAMTLATAQAQNQVNEPVQVEHDVMKEAQGKEQVTFERHAFIIGGPDVVEFVSADASIAGKTVKGSPYSAEAVTESTQTLTDGNRITSKSTAVSYRDSEGRTRREMSLSLPGMTDGPTFITINDPVANASYHLDTKSKTARKLPVTTPDGVSFGIATAPAMGAIRGPGPAVGGATVAIRQAVGPQAGIRMRSGGEPKTESLGKRAIDGILADGTRSTITIPAGEVGNERDILIVTERWYSPELQTVVLSKHSDPRSGETTYSLTNIKRAEPHASLFQVPSDYYTVVNDDGPNVRFMRKIERK
jgi:hypothetical protein